MKKRLIFIIVIIIIAIVVCLAIYNKNKSSRMEEPVNGQEKFGDFVIDVPVEYTMISGDKISTTNDMYTKAIAYDYDKEKNTTYLNVYLQNRGTKEFSKESICKVSFYDEDENFILATSGVVEENFDVPVGGITVVKTQFIAPPGNVASAIVDFESPAPIE